MIEEAMQQAAVELLAELSAGDTLSADERAQLGLPSAGEACALVASLNERLWAWSLAA
ncbi:MAG: hypothetical protein MUF34_30460 [Polyangiaceae bacterium]|nr:hypothetical protein [Polyangiaceae bacterium]